MSEWDTQCSCFKFLHRAVGEQSSALVRVALEAVGRTCRIADRQTAPSRLAINGRSTYRRPIPKPAGRSIIRSQMNWASTSMSIWSSSAAVSPEPISTLAPGHPIMGVPCARVPSTTLSASAPGRPSDSRSISIAFAMPPRASGRSTTQPTCEALRTYLDTHHSAA